LEIKDMLGVVNRSCGSAQSTKAVTAYRTLE